MRSRGCAVRRCDGVDGSAYTSSCLRTVATSSAANEASITRFCDHPQVCTRRWSQKWEVDAESGNAGSGGDAELVQGVFDDRETFHSGKARDGGVDLTGTLSAFGSAHEVTHHVHDLGAVHDA